MRPLTARELQVLRLIAADGLSAEEIGDRLGLSFNTIKSHIAKISKKLGSHSRLDIVATAIRAGLLPEFLPPGYQPPAPYPFFNGAVRGCAQHPPEHRCVECWAGAEAGEAA